MKAQAKTTTTTVESARQVKKSNTGRAPRYANYFNFQTLCESKFLGI